MTAALEGGEWSAERPGHTLPPGKTRYTLYRRLGGPQGRSGRAENLVPTGIRSRTVQPVAESLYRLSYPAHRDYLSNYCKGKGQFHPGTGHEGPEWEYTCSSTLSLTSTIRVGVQRHAPTALPPGKTLYPLYRRLGGAQSRSGRVRKT